MTASLTSYNYEKFSINCFISEQCEFENSEFFFYSLGLAPPTIYFINSKFIALCIQSDYYSTQI